MADGADGFGSGEVAMGVVERLQSVDVEHQY
jgi:hypothetical protein